MYENQRLVFADKTIRLLQAAGHRDMHTGAGVTLPILISCLDAAARAWPEAPIGNWLIELRGDNRKCKQHLKDEKANAAALFQQAEPKETILLAIQNWSPCARPGDPAMQWDALLGRDLILSAQHGTSTAVHQDLIAGLRTLTLAKTGKGRRSSEWDRLIEVDLTSQIEVTAHFEGLSLSSPVRPFVSQLVAILQATIRDAGSRDSVGAQSDSGKSTEDHGDSTYSDAQDQPGEDSGATEGGSGRSPFASVASRLAEANYSSPAEKLGIHSRNYLRLEDLQLITKQLALLLDSQDKAVRANSMLALICLATASSDYQVVNMPLSPVCDGLWLDLEVGCWCWDFTSYRVGLDPQKPLEFEPVFVPLPVILWDALKEVRELNTGAITVRELISNVIGRETVDLKQYRQFLRSLGDTAHPAYQVRFARSMVSVMLEITESDMLTALETARFSCVAPAALFYYHPTPAHIHSQVSKVYGALGLGRSTTPPDLKSLNGQHRPDPNCILAGWTALWTEVERQAGLMRNASNPQTMLDSANACMVTLCAAFVIQTGHRGTRLENLKADCLLGSQDVIVIHDKDDTTGRGRDRPRALPVRPVIRAILKVAVEIHGLMGTAAEHKKLVTIDARTWVFAHFDPEGRATNCVETRQIAALMTAYFDGASTNWARGMWITGLDQAGCDRWLIRTLSGHTRDVTRTGDAYFDIPIHVACQRLKEAMDLLGAAFFGPQTPANELAVDVVFDWTPEPKSLKASGPSGVPDPRTLLAQLSGRMLLATGAAHRIRLALSGGALQATPIAKAVLHLLFLDLIPEPDAALRIGDKDAVWTDVGAPCLTWSLVHFVHPCAYPISSVTHHWIQLAQKTGFNAQTVLTEVGEVISAWGLVSAQTNTPREIWELCTEWAAACRRMHMPPSLLAAAEPRVPSPVLSRNSVMRLSGRGHSNVPPTFRSMSGSSKLRPTKGEDIRGLGKILNHWADHDRRLGELRARATGALSAINALEVAWTPGGGWLLDWLREELERTRDNLQHRYQISSLHTYFSSLTRVPAEFFDNDPYEWDQADWADYFQALAGRTDLAETTLPEEVRHAVVAIASSLSRRGEHIPHVVRAALFSTAGEQIREDSASSVYISQTNIADAITLVTQDLADAPLISNLVKARGLLSSWVPLRTSDLSSLTRDCLTSAHGLVIRRVGFNSHKTESTIRLVPLSHDQATNLKDCRTQIIGHAGPRGDLLMRHDGKDWGVQQDNAATRAWSEGLKVATGCPTARPHSVRASTLQQLVWPEWDESARQLLNGTLGVAQAQSVTADWTKNWVAMASGSAIAGHADIRAALGNYLSPWPLVHAVHAKALLYDIQPGPHLIDELGLSRDAFRQAKHRSNPPSENAVLFDAWGWIDKRLPEPANRRQAQPPIGPPPILQTGDIQSDPAKAAQSIAEDLEVKYLSQRLLGVTPELAATSLDIPWSVAMQCEAKLPGTEVTRQLQQRTKGAAGARGLAADVNTCNGPIGSALRAWLLGLTKNQLELATVALNRELDCRAGFWHQVQNWAEIVANFPDDLILNVAKGAAYTTAEEFSEAASAGTRYRLTADKKLGIRPKASIWPKGGNRVLAARITAVARVTALVAYSLRDSINVK